MLIKEMFVCFSCFSGKPSKQMKSYVFQKSEEGVQLYVKINQAKREGNRTGGSKVKITIVIT